MVDVSHIGRGCEEEAFDDFHDAVLVNNQNRSRMATKSPLPMAPAQLPSTSTPYPVRPSRHTPAATRMTISP